MGSVISLGNELQGVQDGLVDIGCTILVFEASELPASGYGLQHAFLLFGSL